MHLKQLPFLNIRNQIERFLISIPDPLNNDDYLDIYMSPVKTTEIKVDTSTTTPYVSVKLKFDGRIYSMSENAKYLSPEILDKISSTCNSYLQSTFKDYLYKTSKDFKSDINNFWNISFENFFTDKEFKEYNWHENYKNAFLMWKLILL